MTRDELRDLQERKLVAGLDRILPNNSFYLEKLRHAGITRGQVRRLEDLLRLPFTTKDELIVDQEAHPPYGSNLTDPLPRYTRLHQTSGTSGRKLRWLDTNESWNWILDCWQIIFDAVGVRAADRLFFPCSFGPFLGFWAAFEGAARRGCFVLPGGGLTSVARLELMLENDIHVVICTPTYALRLAEVASERSLDLASSPVWGLILAGEPGANIPAVRRQLESQWGARIYDHSGMTEIGSLGIEFESAPGKLVLLEDQAIAEFVDPVTGVPTNEGELSELVLTNLGRWASPLLRYRTGDLVRWRRDLNIPGLPMVYCDNGILGRADDMLLVKGTNIYPSAIEAVVRQFDWIAEFAIEATEISGSASIALVIEPKQAPPDPAVFADSVARAMQDHLYVRPAVRLVEPGALPRFELKAQRLIRKRR